MAELSAELELRVGVGARVPVALRNICFDGAVRLVVTNLCAAEPGYGAVLCSLPSPPELTLDCRVAGGEVTAIPWLRSELQNSLQAALLESLAWPRRVVLPAFRPGSLHATVLPAAQLRRLAVTDPLLQAEMALAESSPSAEKEPRAEEAAGGGSYRSFLEALPARLANLTDDLSLDLSKVSLDLRLDWLDSGEWLAPDEATAEALFREVDTSGDGFIDVAELRGALAKAGKAPSFEEVEALLQTVDANGDGQISLAEFKAALLTPQAMPPALKGLISVGEVVMSRLGAVGGGLSSAQQAAGPSALANWTNATALGAAGSAVTSGWSAVSSAGASAASSIGSLLAWRPRGADADA